MEVPFTPRFNSASDRRPTANASSSPVVRRNSFSIRAAALSSTVCFFVVPFFGRLCFGVSSARLSRSASKSVRFKPLMSDHSSIKIVFDSFFSSFARRSWVRLFVGRERLI